MAEGAKISGDVAFPAEVAGRRTAVFGISGSGKSNTATVIIEGLLKAGEQVVLIDPKGEGWGLLSLTNGKPSNLPIIVFGEPNGHIETLSESHGPRLADFVVETGRSVVLSLLGFESDQSERRFVTTFLRQLYRRKTRQGHPTRTLVVLEEAHLFVPESAGKGFKGDAAELAGAVQRLVRQGRSFGIGTMLVDQRPQDVAKRVVTQCDTLVCHQLVHNTDRDALQDWVKGYDRDGSGKQFLGSLASLDPGEAWVWSPAWLKIFQRTRIHLRKTFDSGAAPDGNAAARAVQRADVDLDALRGQLAEVIEKAKSNDPAALKRRIAELEKQLRDRPSEQVERVVEKIVEVPVLRNGQLDRTEGLAERHERIAERFLAESAELRRLIAPASAPRPQPRPAPVQRAAVAVAQRPARRVATAAGPGEQLPKVERRILTALAQYPDGRTKRQVAVLAGYAMNGGGFNNGLSSLRTKGYVEGGDTLRITDAGVAALGSYDPLPVGDELLQYWYGQLGKAEREILETAASVYPNALTKEDLAARTPSQYAADGGGFNNALSRLRTLELVEGRGEIKASAELFG